MKIEVAQKYPPSLKVIASSMRSFSGSVEAITSGGKVTPVDILPVMLTKVPCPSIKTATKQVTSTGMKGIKEQAVAHRLV